MYNWIVEKEMEIKLFYVQFPQLSDSYLLYKHGERSLLFFFSVKVR